MTVCRCRYERKIPVPGKGGTVDCGRCGKQISHTVPYCRFANVLGLPWVSGRTPWCPNPAHRNVLSDAETARVLNALRSVGVRV